MPSLEVIRLRQFLPSAFAAVAIAVLGAAPASATRDTAARSGVFKGNVCALVKSGALDAADITDPCHQLPTRKGRLGTTWTANWGNQVRVGGADHFLGVSVIKYKASAFPRVWQAAHRYPAQIKTKTLVSRYITSAYDSVTGPEKKGWQGLLSAVTKSGYGITVALFDRPATESAVQAGLIVVGGQVVPVVK